MYGMEHCVYLGALFSSLRRRRERAEVALLESWLLLPSAGDRDSSSSPGDL
jgi:hypothetical protein